MYKFQDQIRAAEGRYEAHSEIRANRQKHLSELRAKDGDWRQVDSPQRIIHRLRSLGLDEVMGEMLASPDPIELNPLERIIKENQLLGVEFILRGAAVMRSIGRVVIRNERGRVVGYGTGFMVSRRLMLTNNHVLESPAVANASIIQFNFYELLDGRITTPVEFELDPNLFFQTDRHLDFTLVAVRPVNEQGIEVASLGWSPFIEQSGKSIVGERVNIIQHPGGEPQQVALRENKIVDVLPDFLHYESDTQRGSSGSPVYNDNWELAALHHAGVPERDDQNRILLMSGIPWNGSSDTVGQIAWVANEGVRISKIVAHLRSKQNLFSRTEFMLFQQTFALSPIGGETTLLDNNDTSPSGPTEANFWQPRINEQGQATWTIPLHIQLGIGGQQLIQPTPPDKPVQSDNDLAVSDVEPPNPIVVSDDGGEVDALLQRMREFSNTPYYDEAADNEDKESYYEGINLDRQPGTVFRNLHHLIKRTHTPLTSYKKARLEYLYPWVDLHEEPNGVRSLKSIYSGKGFEPEEIIREDVEIADTRRRRLQEMLAGEQFNEDEPELIAMLEASAPFNCEHVVPQSWFHEEKVMRADLHHLFTCESGCNSFRSNIPYFQFPPEQEVVRNDCGRLEKNAKKFEPDAGKGIVARATFYFLLRYPGQIGNDEKEMQKDRLDILIDWHKSFPVTLYEMHRNAAIFAIQGNRNPFIDNPDWVDLVDLEAGFS